MAGIKIASFLICCFLLRISLAAPIVANNERIQKLEEQVEELTEKLNFLEEQSLHHTKRQTEVSGTVLNENRKL